MTRNGIAAMHDTAPHRDFLHLRIFLLKCDCFPAVPKVSIEGVGDAGGDIHAQAGSQVALRCLVMNTLVKPRFVHW